MPGQGDIPLAHEEVVENFDAADIVSRLIQQFVELLNIYMFKGHHPGIDIQDIVKVPIGIQIAHPAGIFVQAPFQRKSRLLISHRKFGYILQSKAQTNVRLICLEDGGKVLPVVIVNTQIFTSMPLQSLRTRATLFL